MYGVRAAIPIHVDLMSSIVAVPRGTRHTPGSQAAPPFGGLHRFREPQQGRPLPRLLRLPYGAVRTRRPLFLSERRPVPARRPDAKTSARTRAWPGHDRARARARVLLAEYAGLDPHQLQDSAATHLGDAEAIAAVTAHLAPTCRTH